MEINIVCYTDGSGYWSQVATAVTCVGIKLNYLSGDSKFAEVHVVFDESTWNVDNYGLIYSDRKWLNELHSRLACFGFNCADLDYSEQGMQGKMFVSLDAGPKFINSWRRVQPGYVEGIEELIEENGGAVSLSDTEMVPEIKIKNHHNPAALAACAEWVSKLNNDVYRTPEDAREAITCTLSQYIKEWDANPNDVHMHTVATGGYMIMAYPPYNTGIRRIEFLIDPFIADLHNWSKRDDNDCNTEFCA